MATRRSFVGMLAGLTSITILAGRRLSLPAVPETVAAEVDGSDYVIVSEVLDPSQYFAVPNAWRIMEFYAEQEKALANRLGGVTDVMRGVDRHSDPTRDAPCA